MTMSEEARKAKRAAMRRVTLQLVLGVLVLHAAALAIYKIAGVADWPVRNQRIYTGVWTGATALVVVLLLKRVRVVRYS